MPRTKRDLDRDIKSFLHGDASSAARGFSSGRIDPPKPVEILKSSGVYFKPGQRAYAISWTTHGGMHTQDDGTPGPGDIAYLVAKSKGARGGALWFSGRGIRFTGPAADKSGGVSGRQGPRILKVTRGRVFAGQRTVAVDVQYPGESPMRVEFVGPSTGAGPVVMIARGRQEFVHDPSRFGGFGPDWVRRFYA